MEFQVKPTRPQIVLIALMGLSLLMALFWVIPEMMGVFSTGAEDTYSEWVFDLPLFWVLVIVAVHLLWGILLIGSAWHFLEGWGRRRRIESGKDING